MHFTLRLAFLIAFSFYETKTRNVLHAGVRGWRMSLQRNLRTPFRCEGYLPTKEGRETIFSFFYFFLFLCERNKYIYVYNHLVKSFSCFIRKFSFIQFPHIYLFKMFPQLNIVCMPSEMIFCHISLNFILIHEILLNFTFKINWICKAKKKIEISAK